MKSITFEEIIQLAEQLSACERAALAQYLAGTLSSDCASCITHSLQLAEIELLQVDGLENRRNKYAEPSLELPNDERRASIQDFRNEWETSLDSLSDLA